MTGEQSPAAAVGEIAVLVVAPTEGAQVAALQTPRSEVAGLAAAEVRLVNAGALARSAGPILWPAAYLGTLQLAGALWAGAFLVYALRYGPMPVAPGIDGKPG